ncbi:MAG: helix-turn-helix domain-containing protein [Selenomonadaceae bacterium]|nr:helix-turn-helix domain-containing protein [Selenomonadaceae bacterium]
MNSLVKVNASRIRTLMFERNIAGVYKLARAAGLNAGTTGKMLVDGSRVQLKSIHALAKFFGVNGEELILKEAD